MKLADEVRSYLLVHGRGDEAEEIQLRSVCSGIARLLGRLLDSEERWNRYYWVDAILPTSVTVPLPGELNIQGLVIWGDRGTTQQWWEPFAATMRVYASPDTVLGYQMMFGNAQLGLGKVRYNTHPRGWNWAPPESWLFVFLKNGSNN